MPQTKEEKAAQQRVYYQTPAGRKAKRVYSQSPAGKKTSRIHQWKHLGIISDDWDALYERFMSTTHCEKCSVLLTEGRSRTGKCIDHDHSIKDRPNVRAVLCRTCNSNDRCDNRSGVPNVCYIKRDDMWKYQKTVNGEKHQKYFKTKEEAIRYKYEYEAEKGLF